MKLSPLLSVTLTLIGGAASTRILSRRHRSEQTHNRAAICVDFDDAYAAGVRAGLAFDDLLYELFNHGATHVSLPELSLNRLLQTGQLLPRAPAQLRAAKPKVGHWNYLYGAPDLIEQLAAELSVRLPYTDTSTIDKSTLVFAGELQSISEIGLGFDIDTARAIIKQGLRIVPRPISYAWPEKYLIERTLTQAAALGQLIAFDGNLILGHEMHLSETLAVMEREGLWFAYFAESRHQKGDWFIAKQRAPHIVLAHRFTPEEMIPLDFHAAAHRWAQLARERGIRLCYVNFFKVLHATEPLDGLHYIEHIKAALQADGFRVTGDVIENPAKVSKPSPGSKQELALTGLTSAGIASAAINSLLDMPEPIASALTVASGGGALMLPYLERARGQLEEQYAPSYAPKLIALTAASLAPVAAQQLLRRDQMAGWATGLLMNSASAAAIAAATSDRDYRLRIEEYRGFNLDWLLPLASAALSIPNRNVRTGVLALLSGTWYILNQYQIDPLAKIDPAHAEGHTHHLSTFARAIGDVKIALGLRPASKWASLGPIGLAASAALADHGRKDLAATAMLIGSVGNVFGLAGFRRPERSIEITLNRWARSFIIGAASGGMMLILLKRV